MNCRIAEFFELLKLADHVGRGNAHVVLIFIRPPPRKGGYSVGDPFYRSGDRLASLVTAPADVIFSIHTR